MTSSSSFMCKYVPFSRPRKPRHEALIGRRHSFSIPGTCIHNMSSLLLTEQELHITRTLTQRPSGHGLWFTHWFGDFMQKILTGVPSDVLQLLCLNSGISGERTSLKQRLPASNCTGNSSCSANRVRRRPNKTNKQTNKGHFDNRESRAEMFLSLSARPL